MESSLSWLCPSLLRLRPPSLLSIEESGRQVRKLGEDRKEGVKAKRQEKEENKAKGKEGEDVRIKEERERVRKETRDKTPRSRRLKRI